MRRTRTVVDGSSIPEARPDARQGKEPQAQVNSVARWVQFWGVSAVLRGTWAKRPVDLDRAVSGPVLFGGSGSRSWYNPATQHWGTHRVIRVIRGEPSTQTASPAISTGGCRSSAL